MQHFFSAIYPRILVAAFLIVGNGAQSAEFVVGISRSLAESDSYIANLLWSVAAHDNSSFTVANPNSDNNLPEATGIDLKASSSPSLRKNHAIIAPADRYEIWKNTKTVPGRALKSRYYLFAMEKSANITLRNMFSSNNKLYLIDMLYRDYFNFHRNVVSGCLIEELHQDELGDNVIDIESLPIELLPERTNYVLVKSMVFESEYFPSSDFILHVNAEKFAPLRDWGVYQWLHPVQFMQPNDVGMVEQCLDNFSPVPRSKREPQHAWLKSVFVKNFNNALDKHASLKVVNQTEVESIRSGIRQFERDDGVVWLHGSKEENVVDVVIGDIERFMSDLKEDIETHIEKGRSKKAESLLEEYNRYAGAYLLLTDDGNENAPRHALLGRYYFDGLRAVLDVPSDLVQGQIKTGGKIEGLTRSTLVTLISDLEKFEERFGLLKDGEIGYENIAAKYEETIAKYLLFDEAYAKFTRADEGSKKARGSESQEYRKMAIESAKGLCRYVLQVEKRADEKKGAYQELRKSLDFQKIRRAVMGEGGGIGLLLKGVDRRTCT